MDFLAAAFIFAVSATAFDFSQRRIPDWLNFVFFALGALASITSNVLLEFALFFALSLVFSTGLYRVGAWGGGDAKFFIALSSFLPLFGKGAESIFVLFLVSALLLGVFLLHKPLRFPSEIKVLKTESVKYLAPGTRVAFAPFLALAFAVVVFLK